MENMYDDKNTCLVSLCRWEGLPNGAVIEIARRVSNLEDYMVLHLVCSRWYSVLSAYGCKFLDGDDDDAAYYPRRVPWLMVVDQQQQHSKHMSKQKQKQKQKQRLLFYSMSFQRVHRLLVTLPPELTRDNFNESCLLSSHGWLLVATNKGNTSCTLSLYNPFCTSPHNYIPLPQFDPLAQPLSFALSASPSCTNNYSVLIDHDKGMPVFWRPGDKGWTLMQSSAYILAVTFYHGDYFALNWFGELSRVSDKRSLLENIASLFSNRSYRFLWRAYFVEVEDKLLVVNRVGLYPIHQPLFGLTRDYLTAGFEVVEVDISETTVFKEVKSLGNKSLFVGRNHAFAIEVPQDSHSCYYGCKPNCIYFTDDRSYSFYSTISSHSTDMGVYNLSDGSIQRNFRGLSLDSFSPKLWVEPRC